MTKIYISKERFSELEKELEKLKTEGRHKMAIRLQDAKELGDLSESSEYQEARDEQVLLGQRINQLENTLRNAVIIKKPKSKKIIEVGSRVKVQKDKNVTEYTIIGSNEANPDKGLISNESPLGIGLLGKRVGDQITVKTPKGRITYQVLSIE